MKNLNLNQMESISGSGKGRQCFIDGFLTGGAIVLGLATGGVLGAAGGLLGGLFAGNSNDCFN